MKVLATILLILCSFQGRARTFYFSNSGSDSRTATEAQSMATPWASMTKFNAIVSTLLAGDQVLFKRGDVFTGAMVFTKGGNPGNPIIIGAYGTGTQPIFSGFTNATGFVSVGPNLWESASLGNTNKPNMVTIGGNVIAEGRFPNTGWRKYYHHNGIISITDSTLPLTGKNFVNAKVKVRGVHDQIINGVVTSQSAAGVIGYTTPSTYPGIDKSGYFFSGGIQCLDLQNEWYFNNTTHKVTVYSVGAPTNVLVSTIDTLVYVKAFDYITFDNIYFQGANVAAVTFGGPSIGLSEGITIQNCSFNFSGNDAIYASRTNATLINNNVIRNSLNNAIELENEGGQSNNATITNNRIAQSGMIPGMGVKYNAIVAWGDNILVQYNFIDSSGLTAFSGYFNNVRVLNNYINYYGATVGDCGAINFFDASPGAALVETGRKVNGNIILHGAAGEGQGTLDGDDVVNGVYLDDKSDGVEVIGNFIADVPRAAFYIHNATNVVFRDNTCYDSKVSQTLFVHDDHAIGRPMRNMTYNNNLIFSNASTQLFNIVRTRDTRIDSIFLSYDSNRYARPGSPTGNTFNTIKSYGITNNGNNYTFPAWKAAYASGPYGAYDVHSTEMGGNTGARSIVVNPSNSSVVVNFAGLSYVDAYGTVYNNSLTLAAWSGKVLIANGTTVSNLPPVINAGTDQIIINPPTTSVTLTGTATDPEAGAVVTVWSKVSGPAGETIVSPGSLSTVVNGLAVGVYKFKLTGTDPLLATTSDTVQITVNANQAPTVSAGADQTILIPINTVTVTGSASDPEGGGVTTVWAIVSGPGGQTIVSPNTLSTDINNLTAGIYKFKITATDGVGLIARDTVQITVTGNLPPIINAGADQAITPPTSSVNLTGTASDPEGASMTVSWTAIGGPGGQVIASPAALSTAVNNLLISGIYYFKLSVTDNASNTVSDTVQVTVNVNQPPVINAGVDKSITQPANSVSLTGTASDPEGASVTTVWAFINGPGTPTIVTPGSLTTTINSLTVAGSYFFRLQGTDNAGNVKNDTIQVNVVTAANIAPTANAGTDSTIQLPKNTCYLIGTGADTDGFVAGYQWTEAGVIKGTTATILLTGLTAGTHTYILAVTDDAGATAYDTVQVIVLPAANVAPSANAGADTTITLPVNYVTINGSGADTDGTITYQWTEGVTVKGTTATLSLTALTQGVHTYTLTVTDNGGLTATDTVTVTVLAQIIVAPPPPTLLIYKRTVIRN